MSHISPSDEFPEDALDAWVAEARFDAAAAARRHERALNEQAAEDASIGGVLRDLGERGTPVVVSTIADRRHRASIRAVGRDFAVLTSVGGDAFETVVATSAIDLVRVDTDATVTGDRADELDVGLNEVLPTMAIDRPEVLVVTKGGHAVRGELRTAGLDVIRLRVAGDPPQAVYVPVASIAELVVR